MHWILDYAQQVGYIIIKADEANDANEADDERRKDPSRVHPFSRHQLLSNELYAKLPYERKDFEFSHFQCAVHLHNESSSGRLASSEDELENNEKENTAAGGSNALGFSSSGMEDDNQG